MLATDYIKHKEDYQTPIPICKYMVSLVPSWCKKILEPTPGMGNLVRELEYLGKTVIAPDDYFLLEKQRFDCVVLNPPFSMKYTNVENAGDRIKPGMKMGYQILFECLNMANEVIALVPWFTISDSDVRLRQIKKYGIVSITALPRKTFEYARIQTVVIHFRKGYDKETVFNVYDDELRDKTIKLF